MARLNSSIGLDTNILCYALDPAYLEHDKCSAMLRDLSPERKVAINPTILHEAYHVLVYSQKWEPDEAAERLLALLRHPYVVFCSQTKSVCRAALRLAAMYRLGGRDSLMIANYLLHDLLLIQTHDEELKALGQLMWRGKVIKIVDPLEARR